MVTSNKAGVGSLAPFLPLGFLASPTPTEDLVALHLPPGALVNVFPRSVPVSNLGIVTGTGRLGDGCGSPGLQG